MAAGDKNAVQRVDGVCQDRHALAKLLVRFSRWSSSRFASKPLIRDSSRILGEYEMQRVQSYYRLSRLLKKPHSSTPVLP